MLLSASSRVFKFSKRTIEFGMQLSKLLFMVKILRFFRLDISVGSSSILLLFRFRVSRFANWFSKDGDIFVIRLEKAWKWMRLSHPVKLSIEVNWFCPIFNLVISDFIDLDDETGIPQSRILSTLIQESEFSCILESFSGNSDL